MFDRLDGFKPVGRRGLSWVALCPLHDDKEPSLHLDVKLRDKNFPKDGYGLYGHCTTCGNVLMKVIELFDLPKGRVLYEGNGQFVEEAKYLGPSARPLPSAEELDHWRRYLANGSRLMGYLTEDRGLSPRVIAQLGIGFDASRDRYVLPVYDGAKRETRWVVNLRLYDPNAKEAKMINLLGHGKPARLYPYPPPSGARSVVVAEGEWDVLALRSRIPRGRRRRLSVVCGTAGAGTWRSEWNESFRGKHVTFVYDSDKAGRVNSAKWARELVGIAKSVRVVDLAPDRDDGYDLSDYFASGGTFESLHGLVAGQSPLRRNKGKGARR